MSPLSDEERAAWAAALPERAFNRTDAGNGEYFAALYGSQLRYDHRRRRWLLWGRHWWVEDTTGQVRVRAKEAMRQRFLAAASIDDPDERRREASHAIRSESRRGIDALLVAAQSEAPLATDGQGWDADPLLLGVANGVVDLRSGLLRRGCPEDAITLHSAIAFDPTAACPRWESFLDEIFSGDEELSDWIWRAVGYSLTGLTADQCLFLCHGTGANGKSQFLTVLRSLLGSYARNTPFTTFELHDRSSIPNDIAALVGARVITASETSDGTRLNEQRLKMLTGNDPVTARFLHGEFFTFIPTGKIWFAANHRPLVKDDSLGFWRRVRLIPFLRRFDPRAEPDLAARLRAELPGILAWAIRGVREYLERGLAPVQEVSDATETYRVESDPLAPFIESYCVEEDGRSLRAGVAYAAYVSWAQGASLTEREILSGARFGRHLTSRYASRKDQHGKYYLGVGLVEHDGDAAGDGSGDGL